ncbi:MAG: glycosyltransferase family 4 protein [Candidatus Dormibacteria bacterium]
MTRILVIAPYPPVRDGIAAYTVQSVARLRHAGNHVEVLSPYPSAAHHHLPLNTINGVLRLIPYVRRFDTVLVQYHPDIFFPRSSSAAERERIAAALTLVWRSAAHVEIRVHEADYARAHRGPAWLATRAMWRAASRITVHTGTERTLFHRAYGLPLARIEVERHGSDFAVRSGDSRDDARARLALPRDQLMFLSIGFIQPHKGFDRAIRAFIASGAAGSRGARLDVVGSVRVEEPAYVAHLEELQRLADATSDVHLHVGFIGDEEFDTWIVAADVIVLPYRHIWSSSVMERAALYGRPVLAARVGGLADQARPNTTLFDDDAELAAAMRHIVAERGVALDTSPAPRIPWPDPETATRAIVEDEVRSRAAAERRALFPSDRNGAAPPTSTNGTALTGVSARLRRLPPLQLPAPESPRPGATPLKRLIQRLTRWQLEPIVHQVNELQRVVASTLEDRPLGESDQAPDSPRTLVSPP